MSAKISIRARGGVAPLSTFGLSEWRGPGALHHLGEGTSAVAFTTTAGLPCMRMDISAAWCEAIDREMAGRLRFGAQSLSEEWELDKAIAHVRKEYEGIWL